MSLAPDLLALLRCPETSATLLLDGDLLISVDPASRRAYRVEEGGIPILVVEESVVLSKEEWEAALRRARSGGGD